ncbi:MAG: C25 family cysteine peptidase, partial [Planctomycetota bacterium]
MRVLTLFALLFAAPAIAQDVLVVAPKAFHAAIAPWKAHREAQGHKVAVAEPGKDPREVVQRVHKESGGKLRFVLLVGDVQHVPFNYFPAEIIKKWERDPRVANDNRTADLDGDHIPDVAIGRIPADHAKDAALMLGKVVTYENNRDFTAWRRRVNIVASVGGFGVLQDKLIEQAATQFLKQNVPASYDMHVTYAKPDSPFCPPPSKVMEVTLDRFNEGALFFAYIGHGYTQGFDRCKFKGVSHQIFNQATAWELEAKHGAPIAFLLCCSTGHFDGKPDCISEVMLRQPKGPVAVVSASRVSMPYGNAPFAKELLEAVFVDRKATLGGAL